MNNTKSHCAGLVLLFLVALLLVWPSLAWVGLLPWKLDSFENRRLVAFPSELNSLDALNKWPRQFDRYLDDNLPNRGVLLRLNAWIKYYVFGTSPIESVLVGKQGWLFHRMPSDILEYQGRLDRKPYIIRRLRIVLEERRDWLAEHGIPYLVLIAATKQSIYPEKMPDWLVPGDESHSRRKLLESELRRVRSNLNLYDFVPALRDAKPKWGDALYYRHDSHWTYVGALQAYTALARQYPRWFNVPAPDWVAPDFLRETNLMHLMGLPGEEVTPFPQPRGGFSAKRGEPDTQLLRQMSQRGAVEVYARKGGNGKRLYIMGDSFAGWDAIYLAQNFTRSVLTNTWGDQWQRHEQFPTQSILSEHPDLVVDQMLENRIDMGSPRALLGDPAGDNHPSEVRSARLRRLMHQSGISEAVFKRQGEYLDIYYPKKSKTHAYIVQLNLDSKPMVHIDTVSPRDKEGAWKDPCLRGGEQHSLDVRGGYSESYLCVADVQKSGVLRLRINPVNAVNVMGVKISEHPDV